MIHFRPWIACFVLIMAFIALACDNVKPLPEERDFTSSRSLQKTVSVLENFPADNSMNVPVNTEIRLKFSDRIHWSSVDFFRFRVEDEFGIQVPGEMIINNAADEIRFRPTFRNRDTSLNPGTVYTIKSRFIEDQNGYYVAPYNWSFRTQEAVETTGAFKALDVYPQDTLVFPGQRIGVLFNEEIRPPEADEQIPGEPECSDTLWNDAFQILAVIPLDSEGNLEVRTLRASRICRGQLNGRGRRNMLIFYPANGEAVLPGASYVDIVIKPTAGLRGIDSGEMLEESITKRKYVLPDPSTILNLLF